MWECEKETNPIARKDYDCQAWEWIDNSGYGEIDFAGEDWELIKKARAENFKIMKGQKYLCVRGKYDGEFITYRARPELAAICNKYDLFEL